MLVKYKQLAMSKGLELKIDPKIFNIKIDRIFSPLKYNKVEIQSELNGIEKGLKKTPKDFNKDIINKDLEFLLLEDPKTPSPFFNIKNIESVNSDLYNATAYIINLVKADKKYKKHLSRRDLKRIPQILDYSIDLIIEQLLLSTIDKNIQSLKSFNEKEDTIVLIRSGIDIIYERAELLNIEIHDLVKDKLSKWRYTVDIIKILKSNVINNSVKNFIIYKLDSISNLIKYSLEQSDINDYKIEINKNNLFIKDLQNEKNELLKTIDINNKQIETLIIEKEDTIKLNEHNSSILSELQERMDAEKNKFVKNIKCITEENKSLTEKIKIIENDKDKELLDIKKQLNDNINKIKSLNKDMDKLNKDKNAAIELNINNEKIMNELKSELEEENYKLLTNIEIINKENEELNKKLNSSDNDKVLEITELNNKLNENLEKIDCLNNDMERLTIDREEEKKILNDHINASIKEIEELENKIKSYNEASTRMSEDKVRIQTELDEYKEKTNSLEALIDSLNTQLLEANEALDKSNLTISELKEKLNNKVSLEEENNNTIEEDAVEEDISPEKKADIKKEVMELKNKQKKTNEILNHPSNNGRYNRAKCEAIYEIMKSKNIEDIEEGINLFNEEEKKLIKKEVPPMENAELNNKFEMLKKQMQSKMKKSNVDKNKEDKLVESKNAIITTDSVLTQEQLNKRYSYKGEKKIENSLFISDRLNLIEKLSVTIKYDKKSPTGYPEALNATLNDTLKVYKDGTGNLYSKVMKVGKETKVPKSKFHCKPVDLLFIRTSDVDKFEVKYGKLNEEDLKALNEAIIGKVK